MWVFDFSLVFVNSIVHSYGHAVTNGFRDRFTVSLAMKCDKIDFIQQK